MICSMVFAIIPSFLLIPSTIQTTITSDSKGFQELEPKTSQFIPRTIRVAIYNEPNTTLPSYGSGTLKNNLTDTITILTNAGYQVTNITTQEIYDHKLKTGDYDVFVMADNLPKTNITNYVKEYWLGGGGLLTYDSAISFLCYAGILPPESMGDHGRFTYWWYLAGMHSIYQRHPVSKHYSSGDLFTTFTTTGTFDWAILQTTSIASDLVRIATIDGSPNDVTVLGFDPSKGGGRVVQMPFTNGLISSIMADLVSDAIEWLCPRPKGRILFDLSHMNGFGVDPWDIPYTMFSTRFSIMRDNLVKRSYTFDKLYPSALGNLTTNNLAPYDLLIVNLPYTNFTASEVTSVTNWINDGGGLLALGDEYVYEGSKNMNYLLSSTGLSILDVGPHVNLATSFEHPTEEGCTSLTMFSGDQVNYVGNAFPLWGNSPTDITIAGEEYGNGRIILTGDMLLSDDRIGNTDNLQFSINAANWLTASQAKVLLYVNEPLSPNYYVTPVAQALNELGIPFALTFDSSYLNLSLSLYSWELVVVDMPLFSMNFDYFIDYVDSGGRLIMSNYNINTVPLHPLWAKLGFSYTAALPDFVPIFPWISSHDIFTTPALYGAGNFTPFWDYGDEGDLLTVYPNATALAGTTSSAQTGKAIIVLRNDGKTLYNGYLIDEFSNDIDDSTYEDSFELWLNEIAFMVYQSLSVQINNPLASDVFSTSAPSFNISTDGILLVDTWYTLNNGTEYYVSSTTGTINQAAWDALPEGTVSLKFYVEDEIGQEKYQEVTISKDSQDPTITIANPIADQSFASTAPVFIVEIIDTHLDQMWYTLGSNTTKHFFTANGSIVQSAWDLLAQGTITITFNANDTLGNDNSASVDVIKRITSPGIPGYNSYIIVGLVGTISIIIIKRRLKK